jgi:hypothetical protein
VSQNDALENAWKIHGAITDWTGKVDSKASIALALETGVTAGVLNLCGGHRRLSHIHGWNMWPFYAGWVLLVVALLFVLSVVRPRLRSRAVEEESASSYVFFGHVRHWTPEELEKVLRENDLLPVLAKQLVDTSAIAWRKHKSLQISMTILPIAVALLGLAAYRNG